MSGRSNDSDLISKGITALKWSYLGTGTRIILQLFSQIALARLLGPESFGSFATSMLIIGLGYLMTEAGIGLALIRAESVSEQTIRIAFTWLVFSGFSSSVLVFASAKWLAGYFDSREMALIIQAMAPTLLVQSLGAVSLALLRRDLNYRTIQTVQVLSYLVGFSIVGITAALMGLKGLSLALAWNTQCLVGTLALYAKTRHAIKPLFQPLDKMLYAFGLRTTGANISNWVTENLDNMVVARIYGPAGLGLYAASYNLVRAPTNHLVTSLQQVIFPAIARARRENRSVATGYCALLTFVGLVSLPIFAVVGVLSNEIVEVLYGSKWRDAATLLRPLAFAMPAHALMAIGGPVLSGFGLAKLDLRVQFGTALVFFMVLIGTSAYSQEAVAWGVFAVYLGRALVITNVVAFVGEVSANAIISAIAPSIVVAVVIGGLVSYADSVLIRSGLASVARLVACGLFAFVGSALLLYVFRDRIFSESTSQSFRLFLKHK